MPVAMKNLSVKQVQAKTIPQLKYKQKKNNNLQAEYE